MTPADPQAPPAVRPSRIFIAGSFGQGNVGDDAVLGVEVAQLRARLPGVELAAAVGGHAAAIARWYDIDTVPWDDWPAIAGRIERANLVVQGGGGLFFDGDGFAPDQLVAPGAPELHYHGSFSLLCWALGKPVAIWAPGVGPLRTDEGRSMVRAAFGTAAMAAVRDRESLAALAAIGVVTSRVEVTADPAFALQPATSERARAVLREIDVPSAAPLLGLAVKPWHGAAGGGEAFLAEAVANLAVRHGACVLLYAFQASPAVANVQSAVGDLAMNERIATRLASRGVPCRKVPTCLAPAEVAALVGTSRLHVGLRLHSVLFAIRTGTAAIGLADDQKIRFWMRRAEREDLCRDLDAMSDLPALLASTWASAEDIGTDFRRIAEALAPVAERTADLAIEAYFRSASSPAATVAPGFTDLPADEVDFETTLRRYAAAVIVARLRDLEATRRNATATGRALDEQLTALHAEFMSTVADRDQTIRALQAELFAKVGERDATIRAFQGQLAAHAPAPGPTAILPLHDEVAAPPVTLGSRDAAVAALAAATAELEELRSLKVWQLMTRYWRLREAAGRLLRSGRKRFRR